MKPRELISFLEANGYHFMRSRGGSHHVYSNGTNSVSVPIHGGKDLRIGLIMALLSETELSKEMLFKYLRR
jgi:predicted RNA binding protein YcfA (HicA-like mRNA interferase family)